MAFNQNICRAQVFTKNLEQRFLSLQNLPAYRRRLKSLKPSFIQSSHLHHSAVHSRSEAHLKTKPSLNQWNSSLEISGRTYVPPISNFHHSTSHTLKNEAQLKTKCVHPLEKLSGTKWPYITYVPSTNFHHLAESTMNSNAAYLKNMGEFILKPTEQNIGILKNMGVTVHYVYSLIAEEKKETGFKKNVSSKLTETEETP